MIDWKFEVGDVVKIRWWREFKIEELFYDKDDYRTYAREEKWIENWYNVQFLTLVKNVRDDDNTKYEDTYVIIHTEDDLNKCIEFYKSKWFDSTFITIPVWNYKYFYKIYNSIYFSNFQILEDNRTLKNITDEVLWFSNITTLTKEEALNNLKYITQSNLEKNFPDLYSWVNNTTMWYISWNYIPEQLNKSQAKELLNIKKTKKMSALRNNLWERFFKKNESKIADKVEAIEEIISKLSSITDYIDDLTCITNDYISEIEYAIDHNDKKMLEFNLERLDEQIDKFYEDKLTEQFIQIGNKILESKKK